LLRNCITYLIQKRVYFKIHPFLFCLFFSFPSYSSYYFNSELELAYKEIIQLKLIDAKTRINTEQMRDPQNGIPIYLLSLAETTALLFSEDETKYQQIKSNESAFIKLIQSNNLATSPYHNFCLAEIKLQWAFTKMKFNDEVAAAISTKQALGILNENLKRYPTFVPTKKSLGLLNILIGSIPNSHAWIASSLGFKGNISKGMQMIQDVIDSKTIYLQEGYLIKIIAEQYILNRDPKLETMKYLYNRYPTNILYTFLYASVLGKKGNSTDALLQIEAISTTNAYVCIPAIDYLQGDLLLQQGKYSDSRYFFNRYIQTFKGKNLLKDATYKLFLSYWLNDEDETAMTYWNSIKNVGQATYESDKYAQKIVLSNELPNKKLTKLRLFTDGGYLNKAFEAFNTTNLSDLKTKKDKIEYYYRAARLYQKTGRQHDCVQYYLKVIDLSAEIKNNYYYAPNASLQLGYIYAEKHNNNLARSYFHKAIAYKNHEYENSIEQKAKISLSELR
jgi:hypothetical protein